MTAAAMPDLALTVDRGAFLDAFRRCVVLCPRKSPKPILNCLLLDATGPVSLTGTDLESRLQLRVSGCVLDHSTDGKPVRMVLPARVAEMLDSFPDATVCIRLEGGLAVIVGARAQHKFVVESADSYPVHGDALPVVATVRAFDLQTALKRTLYACDVNSQRYALGGVSIEANERGLTFVATDGYRVSVMPIECERIEGVAWPSPGPIIPQWSCRRLGRVLDDDEDAKVSLAFSMTKATFTTPRWEYSTRLVEGRFPAYAHAFPADFKHRMTAPAGELLRSIRQAAVSANGGPESNGVDFVFSESGLTLESRSADIGESRVEMPLLSADGDIAIAFLPSYWDDCLSQIPAADEVTVELADDRKPAVIRGPKGYTAMISQITQA